MTTDVQRRVSTGSYKIGREGETRIFFFTRRRNFHFFKDNPAETWTIWVNFFSSRTQTELTPHFNKIHFSCSDTETVPQHTRHPWCPTRWSLRVVKRRIIFPLSILQDFPRGYPYEISNNFILYGVSPIQLDCNSVSPQKRDTFVTILIFTLCGDGII